MITALTEVNQTLSLAQLQVGYRVRDEVALFLIHAGADPDGFGPVEPLDLALNMKVLPRIQGGSSAVRAVLQRLLVWAYDGKSVVDTERTEKLVGDWTAAGRSGNLLMGLTALGLAELDRLARTPNGYLAVGSQLTGSRWANLTAASIHTATPQRRNHRTGKVWPLTP